MSPACQLEMKLPGGFPGVSRVTVRLMRDGELSRLVTSLFGGQIFDPVLNGRQLGLRMPRSSAASGSVGQQASMISFSFLPGWS